MCGNNHEIHRERRRVYTSDERTAALDRSTNSQRGAWKRNRHRRRGLAAAMPRYGKVHQVLTNPVYAGAYVYGKTRQERYVDESGKIRKRLRRLPYAEWTVVIHDHHPGFVDWTTFKTIQDRLASNTRPKAHQSGGAVREGAALLQGIATCGRCGRKLRVYYSGRQSTPGYHCSGSTIVNGRGKYCLRIGGRRMDNAVAAAFLDTLAPAGLQAALQAVEQMEGDHDTALTQWRKQAERARYEAQHAERRYRAVDPENRLVARGLEAEWESCLQAAQTSETELGRREKQRPRELSPEEHAGILALGADLQPVWSAPPTTDRDRKELLHTLLEEVIVAVDRDKQQAHLTLRWHGGLLSDLDLALTRTRRGPNRTDEATVDLVRRLAAHYPDAVIAGILNHQERSTATGLRFTANRLCSLRTHWDIPRFEPPTHQPRGDVLSVRQTAKILDVAPSTLHRHLNDGIIAGEQLTPGAPWCIRVTAELRSRYLQQAPEGYVPLVDAMRILGVSRQTVLQRVKRGELQAAHVSRGRRKGLRIKVPDALPGLFGHEPTDGGAV